MKNLIIIGAGGMGRTIYDWIIESSISANKYIIKGFIDDDIKALDEFVHYPPILATIKDYNIRTDDLFICAIGGHNRRKCMESIISKGGKFINFIHPTVRIGSNAQIGEGNIIGPYVSIGPDVKIGNYNFIQNHTIIGHDVIIQNWNRIDTNVVCVGGIKIQNETIIHTSSVINHNVVIGNHAKVGACSFVIRRVKEGMTVFGNPAKQL